MGRAYCMFVDGFCCGLSDNKYPLINQIINSIVNKKTKELHLSTITQNSLIQIYSGSPYGYEIETVRLCEVEKMFRQGILDRKNDAYKTPKELLVNRESLMYRVYDSGYSFSALI